jgi:hypothetical protein
MWKLYLSNNEGIAIQSTYQRLLDSFSSFKDFEIYIGKIRYIDYEKEEIPTRNALSPYLYKRKSFEHEDELRALIWTPEYDKNETSNPANKDAENKGHYVATNLDQLIENIYVAPSAPPWILELIKVVAKNFDLDREVKQSNLASTPIY